MRTCHVATSSPTLDDLITALAPFVEGNAVFIPGRIGLDAGDLVKLNLSLRDGAVVFSGLFESRASYREGTGVMGKAGVMFLIRRLDESSQPIHQQLLRKKRELALANRPAGAVRKPAELPTPGPQALSRTPSPVAHTPAPALVTPQTPKPGSVPAPATNPFSEMSTNAIDFFVEATLTEDSSSSPTAAAPADPPKAAAAASAAASDADLPSPPPGEATTETPPPDFLGLPVPAAANPAPSNPRKTQTWTPAPLKPTPARPPAPAPTGPPTASATSSPTSGLSATIAAPLSRPSATAATMIAPAPSPAPAVSSSARTVPVTASPASATPPASASPPLFRPPASSATPAPLATPRAVTPPETPPPISLGSTPSQDLEELPDSDIETVLTPLQRRWRAISRLFSFGRRRARPAPGKPGRVRWQWVALASAGAGVLAFVLLGGRSAPPIPVSAPITVAPGPSVAPLPVPEERVVPAPVAAVAAAPSPPAAAAAVAAAPVPPPAREAIPQPAVAPAEMPRAGAESGSCTADIESTPAAEVSIGGRPLGRTPLRAAAIPCGASEVVLSHPRYRRWTQSVTADPAAPSKVAARLSRPSARLQLSSTPAGASWKVNGRPLEAGAQSADILRFETVRVEASLPGQNSWRKKFYVKAAVTKLHAPLRGRR